jgi:hypothetical protein
MLEPYAPLVPGFFLCCPSRAQSSPALRLFVDRKGSARAVTALLAAEMGRERPPRGW